MPKRADLETLLSRGVDTLYPSRKALEQLLGSGKRITLYLGVDPTGELLHIGHTVALRKLAQFQRAGHRVILLIGDFTGRIGDPTGRDRMRIPLTEEQIANNAKTYKTQAEKILDFDHPKNPVELRYNSTWLSKLTLEEVIKLASHFTVQQMIERDMFEQRLNANKPISLHEFLYPLLQGYDSVAMNVDMEVGGTDQTFNMLAGRTLQKAVNKHEKFVLTVPLLADAQGVKIGKTEGNVIAITAPPSDLYGKIMSLGDDVILPAFELCTDVPMEEIHDMKQKLQSGAANPRDLKMRLASEIVALYHGKNAARKADAEFTRVFSKGGTPEEMVTKKKPSTTNPLQILVTLELAESKSAAKRLFEQSGVRVNDQLITDWRARLSLKKGDILHVGKLHFVRVE